MAFDNTYKYLYIIDGVDGTYNSICYLRVLIVSTFEVKSIITSGLYDARGITVDNNDIVYITDTGGTSNKCRLTAYIINTTTWTYTAVTNTSITTASTAMNSWAPSYTTTLNGCGCRSMCYYNNTLYFSKLQSADSIYFMPLPHPTYMYSPMFMPLATTVSGFVIMTSSGNYTGTTTGVLSFASNNKIETYTNTGTVWAEDAKSSSYIGLYDYNGSSYLARNNLNTNFSYGNTKVRPPNLIYFTSN
jgi:hypothetical protein